MGTISLILGLIVILLGLCLKAAVNRINQQHDEYIQAEIEISRLREQLNHF